MNRRSVFWGRVWRWCGRAFDQQQQVALRWRDTSALPESLRKHFVDLVDENDAVLLGVCIARC
jgi:hypothetical protein